MKDSYRRRAASARTETCGADQDVRALLAPGLSQSVRTFSSAQLGVW